MKKIREMMKSRKGFTLVEIIVVLVILAILAAFAAFTIPAMLGYVNSAKEKAHLAEARTCLIAAQATIDEYASQDNVTIDSITAAIAAGTKDGDNAKFFTKYTSYINGDTSLAHQLVVGNIILVQLPDDSLIV